MATIATEKPAFGDLVKREYDKLLTRETVSLTGAAGDVFVLGAVVSDDGGNAVAFDPAKGVLGVVIGERKIPAGETSTPGVILARGPAVVSQDSLVFPDGVTEAQKSAALVELKKLLIIPRKSV